MGNLLLREIYSKIKEKELNIDNFISTNLNNINIGAIPEYEQIPLGPGTPGTTTSSDADWFSPPTVMTVERVDAADTYGTTMADAPTAGSPEGSPGSSEPMGAPGYE